MKVQLFFLGHLQCMEHEGVLRLGHVIVATLVKFSPVYSTVLHLIHGLSWSPQATASPLSLLSRIPGSLSFSLSPVCPRCQDRTPVLATAKLAPLVQCIAPSLLSLSSQHPLRHKSHNAGAALSYQVCPHINSCLCQCLSAFKLNKYQLNIIQTPFGSVD